MRHWRSKIRVVHWAVSWTGLIAVLVVGCGGEKGAVETSERPDTVEQPAAGSRQAGKNVDPEKIENCGGFTVEDAAELIGVPVESVTLRLPEPMNTETLKTCAFEDEETGRGISYSLTWADSAEEMQEDFEGERQMVGVAQTSIDAVTGTETESPASYEIPGIGDEAFFAAVNGTVVARVGNVRVQVLNAPDLETRKKVAERVASRLRSAS